MTFLYPGFLMAAGLVSAGVIVLHLLVTQQPKSEDLPTVRFVPDVPAQSTSVAIKPSDLLLLLVRLLIVMLLGLAFAQPQLKPKKQKIARIVMADISRAVHDPKELADSAAAYTNGAATVILFDSLAHEVTPAQAADSLKAVASRPRSSERGVLSSGLIATLRSAARVRDQADSLQLVIVSPFLSEEQDAATPSLRALWPGHIQTVRVKPAFDSVGQNATTIAPRVEWADSTKTTTWVARTKVDTMGAFRAGTAVLVYPFVRRWQPAVKPDSMTHIYARWADGEPAAFEITTGGTCVRSIGTALPTAGDALLRPDFAHFLSGLTAPCGKTRDYTPLPAEFLTTFEGPKSLAPVSSVKPRETRMTPLVPWLLAAALLFALLELLVRRISGAGSSAAVGAVESNRESPRTREVAA